MSFSYPNFIIKTSSAVCQMKVLACQNLKGDGFILELSPWCPEHESFDLPWIAYDVKAAPRPLKLYMDNLVGLPEPLQNYQYAPGDAMDDNTIYIDMLAIYGPAAVLDYSYMMILELRDFYYQKYSTLEECRESCEQIYHAADKLCATLDQLVARKVCGFTWMLYEASTAPKVLKHIRVTLRGIALDMRPPISLSMFKDEPYVYQADATGCPTAHLRTILNVAAMKLYKTEVSVKTTETADANFCTRITQTTLHRNDEYSSTKPMTLFEAEATAICQFLRPTTHELGYRIVDKNNPALATLIFDINRYNHYISILQECADEVANIVNNAKEIMESTKEYPMQETLRKGCSLVHGAMKAFRQKRELYRSVKLQTRYAGPSAPASLNREL